MDLQAEMPGTVALHCHYLVEFYLSAKKGEVSTSFFRFYSEQGLFKAPGMQAERCRKLSRRMPVMPEQTFQPPDMVQEAVNSPKTFCCLRFGCAGTLFELLWPITSFTILRSLT